MNNKRGQVAIFIIIGMIIISIVVVSFLAFPRFTAATSEINPHSYIKNCIEPDTKQAMEILSKQGGYLEPENPLLYQSVEIQYLCYTNQEYQPCLVQQPLLKQHIQNEIKTVIEPRVNKCFQDLEEEYETRGYSVTTNPGEVTVSLIPGSLVIETDTEMTVTREQTQTYNNFKSQITTEMYDLVMIATNIIEFEAVLGGSDTGTYLQYYPDLKINKIKQDGDTIYKVSNVITGEEFVFASRSLVWPQGYNFNG